MGHHYEGPKDKTNPLYYVPVAIIAIALVAVVFGSGLLRGMYTGKMREKKATPKTGAAQVNVRALAQPTEELVTKGRQLFSVNCASCHGAEGRGDGAKGVDLNPLPRNFHAPLAEWTNGASITQMWQTLDKGVPGTSMSAYTLLPGDERIALIHYVRETFVENPPEITPEDIAALPGPANPAGDGAVVEIAATEPAGPTIPVELAMERLAEQRDIRPVNVQLSNEVLSMPGSDLYNTYCMDCHGEAGGGSPAGRVITVHPYFRIPIASFSQLEGDWMQNHDAFVRVVTEATPGKPVHGFSTLNDEQLDQLHSYVAAISREGVIAE